MSEVDISIVILTKNAGKNIGSTLDMVFRQKIDRGYEVIIIDSGSQDSTLKIIKNYPVKIINIKPEEFGHSKTRNLGVKLSKGSYVIFLTGDAIPTNDSWLGNLIQPLKQNSNIAGVYSRQIPKTDCHPTEKRDIFAGCGLTTKLKSVDFSDSYQVEYFNKNIWRFITFSNVSAAYRKDLLEKYSFDESLAAVEDQEWAYRMIKEGHTIYYEPNSCVCHSHSETLKKLYDRYYSYGLSFKKFIKDKERKSFYYFVKITMYETVLDYIFLWKDYTDLIKKADWLFKSLLFRIVKNFAFYQGFNNEV